MNHPEKDIKRHPFANPARGMLRQRGQFWAKTSRGVTRVDASRWLAHIGAKERGKHKPKAGA